MSFSPKNWEDSPATSTPIDAAALEDLETRVTDYADDIFIPPKSTAINGAGATTVGLTSAELVAANALRNWVDVFNDSALATVCLALGTTAVLGAGIVIPPGQSRLVERYTGAINAIASSEATPVGYADL